MANHNQSIKRFRNYYGIYKIYERDSVRYLQHGTTLHGSQVINQSGFPVPTAYFHPTTPAGNFLLEYGWKYTDIGMIGLGTGALAAYACSGQNFCIFELDPDNVYIAEKYFDYLKAGRSKGAKISLVTGDGRMSLGKIKDETFDIFIVDAFNSGSIPVHLITVEAFREYFRVLKKDGILFLHVSNRVLSLEPVVYSNALLMGGVYAVEKSNAGNIQPGSTLTYWMALTRSSTTLELLRKAQWFTRPLPEDRLPRPWTDHYSNIFSAML
jgi:SAM-dependent methyltransferase